MAEIEWDFVLSIFTIFATAVLVFVVILQTRVLHTQTGLGYLPYIAPRYVSVNTKQGLIFLDNVGKGNAVDVCVRIYDSNGKKLREISRFVSEPGKLTTTGLKFNVNSKFRIVGSYKDTNRKTHKFDRTYNYPPECPITDLKEYEENYLARLDVEGKKKKQLTDKKIIQKVDSNPQSSNVKPSSNAH